MVLYKQVIITKAKKGGNTVLFLLLIFCLLLIGGGFASGGLAVRIRQIVWPTASLVQPISQDALEQELAADYLPTYNYAEQEDSEPLNAWLFNKIYWGKNKTAFSRDPEKHIFDVKVSDYASGSLYWKWPSQKPKAKEYEISASYISTAETILELEKELKDGPTEYELIAIIPPSEALRSYSFTVEIPKNVEEFSIGQVLTSNGNLTIRSPKIRALKDGSFDKGYVTLTFDDGYATFKSGALPLLKKYNIPAAVAIVTDFISKDRYLSLKDLKDIAAQGHEIADHTRTHAKLDESLSFKELVSEIAGSKHDLTQAGFKPNVFVFPYGHFSFESLSVVRRAGFAGARSVVRGFNTRNTNPFFLKDQLINREFSEEALVEWLKRAKNNKEWLILEFHNVHKIDNPNDPESITTAELELILSLIKKHDLEVITLSQGLEKMK